MNPWQNLFIKGILKKQDSKMTFKDRVQKYHRLMKLPVDPGLAPNSNSAHVIRSRTSVKATSTKFNAWRIMILLFIQLNGFQMRSCMQAVFEDKQQVNLLQVVRIVKVRHKRRIFGWTTILGWIADFISFWESLGSFRGLLSSDENYFIYVFLYRILVP